MFARAAVEGGLEWGMASLSLVIPLGGDKPYTVFGSGFNLKAGISTMTNTDEAADGAAARRRLSKLEEQEQEVDNSGPTTGRRRLSSCPAPKTRGDTAEAVGDPCCGGLDYKRATPSSTARIGGSQICCHSVQKVVVLGEQKSSFRTCKTDPDIKKDCVGFWGDWGTCSNTCGDGGTRTRTYEVVTAAAYGGRVCKTGTATTTDGETGL